MPKYSPASARRPHDPESPCTAFRQNILLSFLLSLGAVAAAYALLGFAPLGDGTMLTGDLNGLYVAYITDLWRRVRQGGLGYSFAKLCGGSTLGLFAYYMDSPFNLLYLIFPVRAIPYVAQGVFALRTALTGAAACFYFGRHFRSDSRLLPVLSLGYSLCAFCVVSYPMESASCAVRNRPRKVKLFLSLLEISFARSAAFRIL